MTDSEVHFEDELSPIDYLMLRGESDPRTRSSMISLALLDVAPDFERLTETMERTSREFIRLRQHVVVPSLPITAPRWVVDPDFDIRYHVTRVSLPRPGKLDQLLELAQKTLASPLDTSRPLWEFILVDDVNVPGAKAALITKLHHAITDGIGGMLLFKSIYDFERDAPARPMPPLPIPEELTGEELTRKGFTANATGLWSGLSKTVGKGVRWGSEVLSGPGKFVEELKEFAISTQRVMGPPPVEPSPLLRRRSLGRHLSCFDFPLTKMRAAAKAAGVSVNDAYIAGLCGGLRRYHEAMGVEVEAVPLAMPVNLRKDDDPAGGNRFAGARLAAPIGERDPVKRMHMIREEVLTAVAEPAINILSAIAPVMSKLPSSMLSSLSASAASIDIQASNVPGYPEAPYVAGARIVKMYPFGPLPGVAMMVVMVSQGGECCVGIHCDTASVADPDLLHRSMLEGFEEVFATVKGGEGSTKTASTRPRRKSSPRATKPKTASPKAAPPKKPRAAPTKAKPASSRSKKADTE